MALARTPSAVIRAPEAFRSRGLLRALGAPLMLLLAAALSLAAMAMPVVQSSDAAATGYTIRQRQVQLADLTARDEGLQDDIAQLSSAKRIRSEATKRGMVAAPRAALTVTVDTPRPSGGATLPGGYLALAPQVSVAPTANAPAQHGKLWGVLHLLHLK
jgi:hypothetical protein